ncbi:hypothetical protein AGJ35_16025 [Cronobacter dublinensis subsp. dublinensis]|nr:hypothetical protein [Cronobacter dublinensis subsp. dublinensis]EGT5735556.1 hypothetical protein [Cronobacter dublinensis subsp. dublinensis]
MSILKPRKRCRLKANCAKNWKISPGKFCNHSACACSHGLPLTESKQSGRCYRPESTLKKGF